MTCASPFWSRYYGNSTRKCANIQIFLRLYKYDTEIRVARMQCYSITGAVVFPRSEDDCAFTVTVSVETRIVSVVTLLSPPLSHVLQKRRIHCRIPPSTAVTARYYDPVVFTVLISHSFQRLYNERILLAVGVWCNWLWFGPHALSIQFEGDLQGESTWHHAYHGTTSNA